MFLDTKATLDGVPIYIVVRSQTENRLTGTCFRGKSHNLAGNFSRWENSRQLFNERAVLSPFLREIQESYWFGDVCSSICLETDFPVGWTSTGDVSNYQRSDMEEFNPNRKSSALRIKRDLRHILAPVTNLITIVLEVKNEHDKIVVVVHSIYPGRDIGELRGDITKQERVVFFDWNHPGVPL